MNSKILTLLSLLGAVLFSVLFYQQNPGINLLLFSLFLITAAGLLSRNLEKSRVQRFLATAMLLLAVSFALHGSLFSIFVFAIITLFWLGSLSLPSTDWILAWPEQTILGFFGSQMLFLKRIFPQRASSGGQTWRYVIVGVLFVVIFIVFLSLYSSGNAIFADVTESFWNRFEAVFKNLNGQLIFTWFLGLLLSNWAIQRLVSKIPGQWGTKPVFQERIRSNPEFTGLKSSLRFEYRTGILLFVLLNALLLLLNLADIWLVWLGFEWQGQLLKDFVHEGTWNLIISIFISTAIILFYFRGNIGLMTHNRSLLTLTFVWIAQNVFLALSLVIRNSLYISHYGLAYKRIGIFVFLAIVCLMLLLLVLKIRRKESILFFINRFVIFSLGILVLSAIPDWSKTITRYNFANYKKSFVHIEFLADMPDRCLPVMYQYRHKLGEIRVAQSRLGYKYTDTVQGTTFTAHIESRIKDFKEEYPNREWQEWIWADHRAYKELSK